MDSNVVGGVLRALVPAAVAYIVGRGWLSAEDATSLVGALVAAGTAIAAALWSVKTNK
jgi:membrane protein DedA with SNARE-associated domain